MTQHLAAPDRPLLCCEPSRYQVSRAIRTLNRTIFHLHLLAPDLIRDSLTYIRPPSTTCQTMLRVLQRLAAHRHLSSRIPVVKSSLFIHPSDLDQSTGNNSVNWSMAGNYSVSLSPCLLSGCLIASNFRIPYSQAERSTGILSSMNNVRSRLKGTVACNASQKCRSSLG